MKLNRREKIVILGGGVLLFFMAYYFLLYEPLSIRAERAARRTENLAGKLSDMKRLAAEYKALNAGKDRMQKQLIKRDKDFSPFSYLETIARETGLTGKIESMSPVAGVSEEAQKTLDQFDVRLAGIGLRELVHFLYRLEYSDKSFFVENLNIKPRYLTPGTLDVSLRLATPIIL